MGKKINNRKEKKMKVEKNQIGNILKGKKLKGEINCRCTECYFVMCYSWCYFRKYFI